MTLTRRFVVLLLICASPAFAGEPAILPGTGPLAWDGDLSERMMDGLHRYVERKIAESVDKRPQYWSRDCSLREAYEQSIQPNRERLKEIVGIVDPRVPVRMERFGDDENPALVAQTDRYTVCQVRWPVLEGVCGEGLLLEPSAEPAGHAIAIPDADQTPEQVVGLAPGVQPEAQFARRLAENGFRVVVPAILDRSDEWSGNPAITMTNQPHREWIYRQAFQMGRHIIGYEVQKVLAAVDWLVARAGDDPKLAVAGYGEGGLLAFYAAAVDPRIDACLASGYFDSRQAVRSEPIYRNVWGLLREFGDAEIATLVAPRGLVVEYSEVPRVTGPPPQREGRRGGGAAGELKTPAYRSVQDEFKRIDTLIPPGFQTRYLVNGPGDGATGPGSPEAMRQLAGLLGVESPMSLSDDVPVDRRKAFDPAERQKWQVTELENHVQRLVRGADHTRDRFFLAKAAPEYEAQRRRWITGQPVERWSLEQFQERTREHRKYFREEVLGKFDDPLLPANPRARQIYDAAKWTGYEVVLDVFPDVFAWGVLLVPKDLQPGEKRPVVVCQHGRNGVPKDVIEGDNPAYHDFAARLAERGFITFAPHNPYRGEDRYRFLDRKANNVKASLFSFILAQHEQILRWLATQPNVDPGRIAFYGLSYGGETAVRVPPLLDGYCLSICSGDFNDWARKVASTQSPYSFMFTIEWEMPYFNLGSTFNYAEMAYLMIPRPFMVERGHWDNVAPDEWVAYEYAKVRRLYDQFGLGDRTQIEFFNGGHTIHGQGTFQFLEKHLNWPAQ